MAEARCQRKYQVSTGTQWCFFLPFFLISTANVATTIPQAQQAR